MALGPLARSFAGKPRSYGGGGVGPGTSLELKMRGYPCSSQHRPHLVRSGKILRPTQNSVGAGVAGDEAMSNSRNLLLVTMAFHTEDGSGIWIGKAQPRRAGQEAALARPIT